MSVANDKLYIIKEMIQEYLEEDTLVSTKTFLDNILSVIDGKQLKAKKIRKGLEHIVISCDASIVKNPGGPASIGVVIDFPRRMNKSQLSFSQVTSDTTNNLAEYNAIYVGLVTLFNLINNPKCKVEVRSDSQIAIKQINNQMKCKDSKLLNRRDAIQELVKSLPVPVEFKWRPRNSTEALTLANNLAQDVLNVPNH